ncbi:hypothetical protein A3F37_03525 [Candidatus Saccharibacteria bacterium RIFCSPHIGHO2_12_FULL_41_12]|nr:MAG: hypothetical protein A3F37_03525 [Candidatus Saccharibacteria bacterium RIFCSPHIGHO2_12_FULL_41_12]
MINFLNIFNFFAASGETPAEVACQKGSFFAFPTWYKYLEVDTNYCNPKIDNINDIWLIMLAIVEILIRLGVILAIIFIIYGGVSLIMARGIPEKVNSARDMIIDAITGLVIGLVAITLISFLGKSFG